MEILQIAFEKPISPCIYKVGGVNVQGTCIQTKVQTIKMNAFFISFSSVVHIIYSYNEDSVNRHTKFDIG